jgi:hypothetical protein
MFNHNWVNYYKELDMDEDVNLQPAMDAKGLSFFKSQISKSKCFVEYGCGGSTHYAAMVAKVPNIISVDTSKVWVNKVKRSLSGCESNLDLFYCDVGEIGNWGTPVNGDRYQHFWRYTVHPWNTARKRSLEPDLVLVDGRFRVASFLYSLVAAKEGALIMFDDYLDRKKYAIVEDFCQIKEIHGRMAVFCVDKNYTVEEIVAAITQHSVLFG